MEMICGYCGVECGPNVVCEICNAVHYCCQKHAKKDRLSGHADVCSRLALHRTRVFPVVPFSESDFPSAPLWDAYRHRHPPARLGCPNREEWAQSWGLDAGSIPCLQSRVGRRMVWGLHNWQMYLRGRGLRRESLVSVLLHYPLSVYYALLLKRWLAPDERWLRGRVVKICYLGPEVEICVLPVFWELSCLLADFSIELHFIGPEIPQHDHSTAHRAAPQKALCSDAKCSCHAGSYDEATPFRIQFLDHGTPFHLSSPSTSEPSSREIGTEMSISLHMGYYHDWESAGDPPDLIFASNAGLELYDTWQPTLSKIMQDGVFTVLTDYTEEAIYRTVQFLNYLGHAPSFTFMNPFHCPIRSEKSGMDVPCFSNAFGVVLNAQTLIGPHSHPLHT